MRKRPAATRSNAPNRTSRALVGDTRHETVEATLDSGTILFDSSLICSEAK